MKYEYLELEEAVEVILDSIDPIDQVEEVSLEEGLGRILAEDFYAPRDNPGFDRSPLDGFALRSEDTQEGRVRLEVIDTVYAGHTTDEEVKRGQCVRLMTGSKMPEGSDCVIRLEDVEEDGGHIIVDQLVERHENYIFKGEDVEKASLLMEKGNLLNFSHIGILASMGQAKVQVLRRPRVAVLSTGDELVAPGQPLPDGKIYESNGIMLAARLQELGMDWQRIETREDEPDQVGQAILNYIGDYDLMITTGGVSVGDKDIFHEVVDQIGGEKVFWRVRIKPGTPVMYSMVGGRPLLSLSGNPFAALTNFELLARPLLSKLSGDSSLEAIRRPAIMKSDFPKGSKKIRRFVRSIYRNGEVYLPEGQHSSGSLSSMRDCNALIDMELGRPNLRVGDQVEVIMI